MAEEGEHPEGIGRPPVIFVAIDHDGRVAADAFGADQCGELRSVDVVALHRVVEIGVPVDLDGAGDVSGLVKEYVFIRLDDDKPRCAEVSTEPVCADETPGVCECREARGLVDLDGHLVPPVGASTGGDLAVGRELGS